MGQQDNELLLDLWTCSLLKNRHRPTCSLKELHNSVDPM